ncbi:MAG: RNA-binding protein [Tissierellia bacterium]|nr:RNA-binding protein [Tissierellia bacterium]
MKGKIKKFTNEGALVEVNGKEYLLEKGMFRNLEVGYYVDVEISSDGKKVYLEENLPVEGEIRVYTLKQRSRVGWFLETGTEEDLFVPFGEAFPHVREGDKAVVKILRDEKNRLYGTMKIKSSLKTDHSYKENDRVDGVVYSVHPKMGVFVLIDGKYDGRLEPYEVTRGFQIGDESKFRVKHVLEDGKMALSLRERGHLQMDKDTGKILERLSHTPRFSIGDKSSPEDIFREFKMSKQAFKRAAGRLKKLGLVDIGPHHIRRVEK